MKRLILALLFFVPSLVRAAEFDAKAIDALAEQALKDFEAPGLAIAIVKDDKVLLARGYGVRTVGGDKPVTADTLFAIASCSKAFTAAAVAALIDDKKMAWDDKVSKHLPSFHLFDPLADHEVTLRDCLCHRCGLSRHDVLWIQAPQSREEILKRVAGLTPTTSFRSTWEYNNAMFVVAGQAVGAVGGSWEDVVQKKIFTPLGMKAACFDVASAERLEHARPHRRNDKREVETFPWEDIRHVGPAGAINANVNELCAWLRVQLNDGKLGDKRILSAATMKEMHTAQMVVRNEGYWTIFFPPEVTDYLSYGLGWCVHGYRGQHCLSHGGTLEGFRAQMVLVPKEKLGIVVLTNLGGCRLPEALTKNVVDLMLDLPTRDWNKHYLGVEKKTRDDAQAQIAKRKAERKPDTKPSLKPEAYAGTFSVPGYGDAVVTAEGDQLMLKWNGFTLKLEHFHFDTFDFREPYKGWPDDRVTFVLNSAGKVVKIKFLGQEFAKK
jgi:CubicO group peptidase (beta-lactamase class C family)